MISITSIINEGTVSQKTGFDPLGVLLPKNFDSVAGSYSPEQPVDSKYKYTLRPPKGTDHSSKMGMKKTSDGQTGSTVQL